MLSILDRSPRLCDGLRRREILRAGTVAMLGGSAFTHSLNASTTLADSRAKKSCIILFLMGGPPQHSTWDPKPNAPAEIRGEIVPIATNVPGLTVGELMPRTAMLMDRVAVIRAMSTDDN